MDISKVRFTYFNIGGFTDCPVAIATVAGIVDENQVFHYGVSFCSPNDRFEKSEGRKRAVARLMEGSTLAGKINNSRRFALQCAVALYVCMSNDAAVPGYIYDNRDAIEFRKQMSLGEINV